MGKYDELGRYLSERLDQPVTLSFAEMDRLVSGLPPAARNHPSYWGNRRASHVWAGSWLDHGRRVVSVDLDAGLITFSAANSRQPT